MRQYPKRLQHVRDEHKMLLVRRGLEKIEKAMVEGHGRFPAMIDRMLEMFYDDRVADDGSLVIPPAVTVAIFDRLGTIAALKEAAQAERGLHKTSGKSTTVTNNFLQFNLTPEKFRELPETLQREMIDAQILALTKAPEALPETVDA